MMNAVSKIQPRVSVVVAVMNEELNIATLLQEIRVALKNFTYEIIVVDDGSTDKTVEVAKKHLDPCMQLIVFRRNFGQTQAMSAGIEAATGKYIATMDGDLQNDPADIPGMIEELESRDVDVVTGYRKSRQDGFILRKLPSMVANFMIRRLTGVYIRDYGCSLKLFKSEVAKNLEMYGELHRFIPVLAYLYGAKISQKAVNHRARTAGTSKYGIGRTAKVASDLLLLLFFQKYFRRPIHFFGPIGILSFALGASINLYLLFLKSMGSDIWGRPILILGVLLLLLGVQLFTFGILCEMVMRVYYQGNGKKPYVVKERFFNESA